jgi:hypothetical protein
MPAFRSDDDEQEDATFDEVAGMADRLGLQGQKRAAYIDDHMQGLGYEAIQSRESYRKPSREGDGGGDGGGFGKRWGFGQRQQGASGGGQRGGRDDDTFN